MFISWKVFFKFFLHYGKFTENTQGVIIWQSKGLVWSEGIMENREHLFDLNWVTWFKKHQNNTQNYICHPTLSRNTIPMLQSGANSTQSAIFSQPHMAVKIQWRVKPFPIFFNPWEMDAGGQSAFSTLLGKESSKHKSPWLLLHFVKLSSHAEQVIF